MHGLQRRVDEVQRRAVVRGVAGRKPVADEPLVGRPAVLLAVVVRTGASRQDPEPVAEGGQRAEGIGHARLEPADHARADAGEDDPCSQARRSIRSTP
mgnify:CR=1 FL=1